MNNDHLADPVEIDLSQPIPSKRKDPVIEFKRFMTSAMLEEWQVANPHYAVFGTEFHPCKEEGYDVALYITCGDLAAFNEHNDRVDAMTRLRAEHIAAMNDADPDVVTEPPAGSGDGTIKEEPGVTVGEPEDDLSPPDSAEPVVAKTKKKNA